MVNYCFVNIAVWGSLLAAFVYWSVGHPFSFRQLKVTGRIRYAHIISILLSLIIPLPSAFAPLIDGSVFTTSLVLPCLSLNADYVYSTFILPINILLGIQVVLLVLIIWILFKVRGTAHGGLSGNLVWRRQVLLHVECGNSTNSLYARYTTGAQPGGYNQNTTVAVAHMADSKFMSSSSL